MHGKKIIGTVVVSFVIFAAVAAGQSQTANAASQKTIVPLKVDVVFKEYQGTKEVSSLPYTIQAVATEQGRQRSSLRMGINVPIAVGETRSPSGGAVTSTQFNYQHVGTNIDCLGNTLGGGLFDIHLILSRSSLYSPKGVNSIAAAEGPSTTTFAPHQPIFSTFNDDIDLLMRDGQTIESTMATDPVSGRVLKVDVTLHVMR